MAVVRYFVSNLDRSLRFYVEVLGFEFGEQWGPAFARIAKEGLELWLSGPGTSAARPMPDGRSPEPGGWNRIVLVTPDLENRVAELRAHDVSFRGDLISGPGGSQVLIEDPDGNPIELFEPRA